MKENQVFVLSVIGYNKVQLRKFNEQHPAVILVNYETKTLSIVPCPLDFATMGDNVQNFIKIFFFTFFSTFFLKSIWQR
jgi:hypothetical protein